MRFICYWTQCPLNSQSGPGNRYVRKCIFKSLDVSARLIVKVNKTKQKTSIDFYGVESWRDARYISMQLQLRKYSFGYH